MGQLRVACHDAARACLVHHGPPPEESHLFFLFFFFVGGASEHACVFMHVSKSCTAWLPPLPPCLVFGHECACLLSLRGCAPVPVRVVRVLASHYACVSRGGLAAIRDKALGEYVSPMLSVHLSFSGLRQ